MADIIAKIEGISEKYYGFLFHYYRAEVYRATIWRNRLDVTTNWAIIVTAGILSFVFSNPQVPHTVILMNYLIAWFFLYVESRRFRYYSIMRYRTRTLEEQIFAPLFAEGKLKFKDKEHWLEHLSQSLTTPIIPMSRLEAVALRLRRNYLLLFPVIFFAWLVKVQTYPIQAVNAQDIFLNARLWYFSGEIVFTVFIISVISTLALAMYIPQASSFDDLP